jgi:hypothetical protein
MAKKIMTYSVSGRLKYDKKTLKQATATTKIDLQQIQ